MAFSLCHGFCVSCPHELALEKKVIVGSSDALVCKNEFRGNQLVLKQQSGLERWVPKETHSPFSISAQASICVPRAMRWWEKTSKPNMTEIKSTQHLVDSLLGAGDKLVIVDFYSPGCGGCKALHPKICQFAEQHPNATFLMVNYEEHRPMCQSLHVRVLPFFRFYRGARGRVSSFSCTNATIKKFRDALGKHGAERCGLGPAKGLEESELTSLASKKGTNFSYPLSSSPPGDFSFYSDSEGRTDMAMASPR
ncbi:uncharacterized protein A4U43_C03F16780 [Asparagus officinalis]|uniref:Thioredoxin domain-containing protein n=1 Tax=Asparagus officinalis TaxID=4686 RepID=A0A5P1FB81_ASPOF|nr:thioredoxin-like 1-1, chloroplastic isoform X2 [Asparagus officinalis]ONK75432.1 uncharacterized protein A4U43_C03F16780 [Asparagus officinalis]